MGPAEGAGAGVQRQGLHRSGGDPSGGSAMGTEVLELHGTAKPTACPTRCSCPGVPLPHGTGRVQPAATSTAVAPRAAAPRAAAPRAAAGARSDTASPAGAAARLCSAAGSCSSAASGRREPRARGHRSPERVLRCTDCEHRGTVLARGQGAQGGTGGSAALTFLVRGLQGAEALL